MKQFFSRLPKKAMALALVVTALVGVGVAAKAWYPDRPTYTVESPAPHVTFNSITNNADEGDERAFFELKDAANTQPNSFSHTMADLKDGQELLLRVYVHNNAADNLNTVPDGQGGFKGIARNTKVRVNLPTATADSLKANAYISADNALPQEVADTINLGGATPFGVEYQPGSATIYTNAVPTGMKLADSIVTSGAPIGYDKLDGIVPGCFKYTSIVTLKVKVKAPHYNLEKQVRFAGQTPQDWQKSITAKPGDKLEWSISFRNIGSTQLKDVVILDEVPAGLTVVPGSIMMYDANFPNGYKVPDGALQANGRQINLSIGTHNPLPDADKAKGYVSSQIIFAATIGDLPTDKCEDVSLTNKAYATPAGYGSIFDTAKVVVKTGKVCAQPPAPNYTCDMLTVEKYDNRKVRVTIKATGTNGATVKTYTYDFGEGKPVLVTDKNVAEYTYAKDGNYMVRVKVTFDVNGTAQTVDSNACAKQVSYTTPSTPVTPTPPTPQVPTTLPNTGPEGVMELFAATSVAGAAAHRVYTVRRRR